MKYHLIVNLKKTTEAMEDGKIFTTKPYYSPDGNIVLKKEPLHFGEENKAYHGRAIITDSNILPYRLSQEGVSINEFKKINDSDSFLAYLCGSDGKDGVDIIDSLSGITSSKHIPTDIIKKNRPDLCKLFPEGSICQGKLSYKIIGERTLLSLIPLLHPDISVNVYLIKQTYFGDSNSEIDPGMGVLISTDKDGLRERLKISYDQHASSPLIEGEYGGIIANYTRFKNYGNGPVEIKNVIIDKKNRDISSLIKICAN